MTLRSSAAPARIARRIEEASLNAWPALHQLVYDGWLLRLTRGFTKRANCAVPLYPGTLPIAQKLAFCRALYAREGLGTIVRLATANPIGDLDEDLSAAGFARVEPTRVMACPLEPAAPPPRDGVEFQETARDTWLELYGRLAEVPSEATALHGVVLDAIRLPIVFGSLLRGSEPVACGLAVTEHDVVGLFDVVTRADVRRRGHAGRLVRELLARGRALGAQTGYLQVTEQNVAARSLYRRLGFVDVYEYWYRVAE